MDCKKLASYTMKIAHYLDSEEFEKQSSITYPKDLGNWGLEENKLDELRRHLKKLKVELKVFDLEEDEFPTLKGKELVELELKSSISDARKVMDILKRLKAFSIEKYHVTNLKKKEIEEKFDKQSDDKISENDVKNIVHECFTPNFGELNKNFSDLKGEITYSDDEGTKHIEVTGLVDKQWVDKYFGSDEKLERIEKQLSQGYYGGPGQSYSRSHVSLKPKNDKQYEFTISIQSGLDI